MPDDIQSQAITLHCMPIIFHLSLDDDEMTTSLYITCFELLCLINNIIILFIGIKYTQ